MEWELFVVEVGAGINLLGQGHRNARVKQMRIALEKEHIGANFIKSSSLLTPSHKDFLLI